MLIILVQLKNLFFKMRLPGLLYLMLQCNVVFWQRKELYTNVI